MEIFFIMMMMLGGLFLFSYGIFCLTDNSEIEKLKKRVKKLEKRKCDSGCKCGGDKS